MKNIPIGISDFKEIINEDYYYVDKTLLIKELHESTGSVILIPRPRRFGKTLNLSMVKYFFEKTEADTSALFAKTAIWQHEEYRKLQGTLPVISLTFKDVKEENWENCYKKLVSIISKTFEYHQAVLEKKLSEHQRNYYRAIIERRADEVAYHESLSFLSKLLYEAYNEKVIILIDEYDAPIHAGYAHDYYKQVTQFMRSLLTSVLKDNTYLKRGILTGILRTAKEGIFSGLNNLKVYSLLNKTFQDKFGFTQQEVTQLVSDYDLSESLPEIQEWYNGYTFGSMRMYNPWSLLMCMSEEGALLPYWVNTSDNQIIKKIIASSGVEVKTDLELLLDDQAITKVIDETLLFPGIENNAQAVWSLLLFSGYLTFTSCDLKEGIISCNLIIPNKEIRLLYRMLIKDIFQATLKTEINKQLLQALKQGDVALFSQLLQEFVINSISMFDLPNDEPEKSYHLFVLGLLVTLLDTYYVKSNRESGYGRYDIMLIPHDKNQFGFIVEFKKVSTYLKETLEIAAQRALEQVITKEYAAELKALGIKKIKALGIAFQGKNILVLDQDIK